MIVFELSEQDMAALQHLAGHYSNKSTDLYAQKVVKNHLIKIAAQNNRRARRKAQREARP